MLPSRADTETQGDARAGCLLAYFGVWGGKRCISTKFRADSRLCAQGLKAKCLTQWPLDAAKGAVGSDSQRSWAPLCPPFPAERRPLQRVPGGGLREQPGSLDLEDVASFLSQPPFLRSPCSQALGGGTSCPLASCLGH